MALDLDDVVKARMLNGEEKRERRGWGLEIAGFLVVAVILIAAFVCMWQRSCNEKVQFATSMARLDGRVDAIEPAVTAHGNSLYELNGTMSATVQGVKNLKESVDNQLFELNDEIFYNPGRRGRSGNCGSCGNREFRQSSTYNLANTTVTVDETCRN